MSVYFTLYKKTTLPNKIRIKLFPSYFNSKKCLDIVLWTDSISHKLMYCVGIIPPPQDYKFNYFYNVTQRYLLETLHLKTINVYRYKIMMSEI